MDICEDLIVEHEGESLLDSGLGGLPVVERAWALVHVPHVARRVSPPDIQTESAYIGAVLGMILGLQDPHLDPLVTSRNSICQWIRIQIHIRSPDPDLDPGGQN